MNSVVDAALGILWCASWAHSDQSLWFVFRTWWLLHCVVDTMLLVECYIFCININMIYILFWYYILKCLHHFYISLYASSAAASLPSVLWHCRLGGRKGIRPVKTEWWGAGVVVCLEQGADLHMAQLVPLPLTVSCFSKIPIGFLVPAHLGSPRKRAVKWACVCVCVYGEGAWSKPLYTGVHCIEANPCSISSKSAPLVWYTLFH